MDKNYYFPIPKKNLTARFSSVFERSKQGQSSTLIAFPGTGRTSHLRFVDSQNLYSDLWNCDPSISQFIFLDIDRTQATFRSFLYELLSLLYRNSKLDKELQKTTSSTDDYLISNAILERISVLSKQMKLTLILTLNSLALPYIAMLDRFIVLVQKNASVHPVSIIWSVDSEVYRNFTVSHPSSSFFSKTFYYSSFNEEESVHSLHRHCATAGIALPASIKKHILNITGGISATFHPLVDILPFHLNTDTFEKVLHESPIVQKLIENLKRELQLSPTIVNNCLLPEALTFLSRHTSKSFRIHDISLSDEPTAQDILLLKALYENLDQQLSRDALSQRLWGNEWLDSSSDWALDKAISRLRKKIQNSEFRIITIKNYGYQLMRIV